MSISIPSHYFKTTFSSQNNITHWPIHFAILGIPDASDAFSNRKNEAAESLSDYLSKHYCWVRKLTGDNSTRSQGLDHYFAVNMSWNEACDLGQDLSMEAIFYVADNTLSVTYTDVRRKPVVIDSFLKRFNVQSN